MHICVSNLARRLNGTKPLSEPMLKMFNSNLRNKQGNRNRNSYIFYQEHAFENIVWKMAATLSRPQYVNGGRCVAEVTLL